jgi:beta-phosphoglucomutase-like phosphatase (HAD superfamily)
MTLHDHFQCLVTAEDELDTISQRLLTASIKLGRAPNFCVYFDSSPRGITAAHNCTLKAVAVQVREAPLVE